MRNTVKALATAFALFAQALNAHGNTDFDLVIQGGRVIDPETQLDAQRDIGIQRGKITAISASPLFGKRVIDVSGQTVSPGFIDIHSHSPTLLGQHLNLHDGITTQLELEMGAWPISAYGDHFTGGAQLNFGASVSHAAVRVKVIEDKDQPYAFVGRKIAMSMGSPAWSDPATSEQIEQMRALLREGLQSGGLGIGLLLDYMTSAISPEELAMVFDTAAEFGRPVAVHVRRGLPGDPSGIDEIIQQATRSGAPTLICHITHSAMGAVGDWLEKIDAANLAGARITTETLSWPAGGTSISADVFRNRDWRKIFDIDYTDVQWVATGEWLTEDSWHRYQQTMPYGMVNHHYVKEAWIERALQWPNMMVSTDALPALDLDTKTNPNIAGTFSRLLGHYVRDQKVLTLSDAIKRITLLPAQWLEQASPVFKHKGRIQVGADADLVIFDPKRIATTAAYGDPYQTSAGVNWVIVGGSVVIENGQRLEGRYPGRRLIAPPSD